MSVVYRKGREAGRLGAAAALRLRLVRHFDSADLFSPTGWRLLDRGVVYVIAHIRGGGEMGEEWRDAGRMMKKMNTFTDFIACAEHLVKNKYTSSDRLVIQGGSAGGLLMGAVTNMRPDLFKAVVAQVPFVDVLNTMLDASLPLTTSEYIEWGNPNEKAAYDYMKKYSPYDNVHKAELSGDAGEGFAQRQPGAVLGRREVRGQAARDEDRQQSAAAESEHGRRPRRRVRPLRLRCTKWRLITRSCSGRWGRWIRYGIPMKSRKPCGR